MIRKFAAVSVVRVALAVLFSLTILAGTATLHAQQPAGSPSSTPAQPAQQPSAQPQSGQPSSSQQSSSQEASPEETIHRPKPKNYKNWNFNVGGGANLTGGTTKTFVRSGGGTGAAGVARNFSQYFGFRADFQFDNLPLRQSALSLAQAPGASDQAYAVMVDPIINLPVSKDWGGYIVFGPDFIHRSGKLDSSTALPGIRCNTFFTWWGNCLDYNLPLDQSFLKASQNEFGYNFGAGITHRVHNNIEIYGEIRLVHGTHNSVTTDFRPVTIGLRW